MKRTEKQKGVTLDQLGEDIIKSLEQMSPEEREKLRQQMDRSTKPDPEMQLDIVTSYMVRRGIALTQKNWIEMATMGDASTLEELGPEIELPDGFENWPATELQVN